MSYLNFIIEKRRHSEHLLLEGRGEGRREEGEGRREEGGGRDGYRNGLNTSC
jgi:hypothetical protein